MRNALLMVLLFVAGVGAAFLIASPGAGARSLVDGTLTAHVGLPNNPDAFSIGLSATTVAAGTYELDINDYADIHNFHFCNEGVNAFTCAANAPVDVATTIGGQGLTTFMVTLAPGTYIFHCDAHSSLHGTLVVTDGGTTSTGTTTGTTTTDTTTTSTTTTTPVLGVKIISTTVTRKLVTVKVKASQPTHITASLLGKTTLTDFADAATDGTIVTLKLKPLAKLAPGKYVVKVTVACCGTSTTRQKTIVVM